MGKRCARRDLAVNQLLRNLCKSALQHRSARIGLFWHEPAPPFMADNGLNFEPRLIKGDLFAAIPGAPGALGRSPTWSRALAGRSRGTDVSVRISLIFFFNPRGMCDPGVTRPCFQSVGVGPYVRISHACSRTQRFKDATQSFKTFRQ